MVPASPPSFPHTRGGGPHYRRGIPDDDGVFPTRVGVDLAHQNCDDVCDVFSPHAWGWTAMSSNSHNCLYVFPTRVGVDRTALLFLRCPARFPHTRGGGPVGWLVME